MSPVTDHIDAALYSLVKEGSKVAFDEIYTRYWEKLYNYAYHRTWSKDVAFEIVQDIFVSLWSRREVTQVTSLSGYLFGSVRFQIINYIRKASARAHYLEDYMRFISTADNSNEESIMMLDLQDALEKSIDELPDRCREITRLSMIENLPIEGIAVKLKIAERTVENQLAIARKRLRTSLSDFVTVYLILGGLL